MRKVKIKNWKVKTPDGEKEENLLVAINAIINSLKPQEMPVGIEKFKIFGKIAESFEKAEKTGTLELEEREYQFLRDTIEKKVPAGWAFSKNISEAIELFMNAKEE
jgi:hypothetical protein